MLVPARLQEWAVQRFGLQSKRQAFLWVLAGCLAVALGVFGSVVLAWA